MRTEIGEYIVGAYLQQQLRCDFVGYNIRPPEHGLEGLAEMDVVGLRFHDATAFLCEVTTHLNGLQYGTYAKTIARIGAKLKRQKQYARLHLKQFQVIHYMLWSPIVRSTQIENALKQPAMADLELIINEEYTRRVRELEHTAQGTTRDTGNPVFRVLQLLAHLRPVADEATTPVPPPPGIMTLEQFKRKHPSNSWVQLRRGCLDWLGYPVKHSTKNVRATSRTFSKQMSKATGIGFVDILRWLDAKGLGN